MKVGTIILDCASTEDPDARTIERIARLGLAARRCAVDLQLVNVSRPLRELIALCGLATVLRVEPERQPE